MIAKLGIASAGFLLVLCATLGLSQATADKQQEFAAHIQKAKSYLDQKQPALAIPEFQAAVVINPESVDAQANLGVLLFFGGKAADSIPHFRAALKGQPGLAKIQGLLGMAESRTLDFEDARKDMEAAFPAIPDQRFQVQLGLELVGLYTDVGDLERAAVVIAQLRKSEPDNAEVLYAAYRTYSDLAGEAMLSLSLVAPNSALMHQLMAHELAKQGDTAGAIGNYREALKIDPQLPGLHFELAEMLNSSGTPDAQEEAKNQYKAALATNSLDEKSECRLGEIAYRESDLKESFARYSRAVQLQPNDPEANIGLAKALIEMKQPQKAQALLEHALQIDPTNSVGHFRLSMLYRQDGRVEDAKRELQEYQKYKDMKEKLKKIYQDMRLQPAKPETDEADAQK